MRLIGRHAWFHAFGAVLALPACALMRPNAAMALVATWGLLQGGLAWTSHGRWRWHGASEWLLTTVLLLAPWWLNAAGEPAQRVALVLGMVQAAAWLVCHDPSWQRQRPTRQPLKGPLGWWSREEPRASTRPLEEARAGGGKMRGD